MTAASSSRTPFVLTAVGGGLAALYWGVILLLAGTSGGGSWDLAMPGLLIALYGWRAVEAFRGDRSAANSLLWLQGAGALVSVLRMWGAESVVVAIYGVKLLIHAFGAWAAWTARTA